MNRRDFLELMGAGTLAARFAHAETLTSRAKLTRIGLETYSVRKAMAANPERTLAAIRAIGYTDVELLWSFKNFGQSDKEVRDTLKRVGIAAPSAHISPDLLLSEWESHVAAAKMIGHQYLIVPSLPSEANKSLDVWKLWADRFNVAGEVARRGGIWLAFHNEPDHSKKLQGEVPIEVFANAIDPKVVRLQLDVGNMLMGGGDPMDFLSRHRSQCWSFHLKNVVAAKNADTELPKGVFDIGKFLAAVPELNKKPCYVEQEASKDEMASAKENFEYLKGLVF